MVVDLEDRGTQERQCTTARLQLSTTTPKLQILTPGKAIFRFLKDSFTCCRHFLIESTVEVNLVKVVQRPVNFLPWKVTGLSF